MKKRIQEIEVTKTPERKSRGRKREDASFPVAPPRVGLPDGYAAVLEEIKGRIQAERLRTIMAANSAMVMLYWDIGGLILERQEREGQKARVPLAYPQAPPAAHDIDDRREEGGEAPELHDPREVVHPPHPGYRVEGYDELYPHDLAEDEDEDEGRGEERDLRTCEERASAAEVRAPEGELTVIEYRPERSRVVEELAVPVGNPDVADLRENRGYVYQGERQEDYGGSYRAERAFSLRH